MWPWDRFVLTLSGGLQIYSLLKTRPKIPEYSVSMSTILLSKAGSFKKGDLSVSVQVLFVSTQNDDDVLTGQHPGITQPCGQSIVCLSTANSKARF